MLSQLVLTLEWTEEPRKVPSFGPDIAAKSAQSQRRLKHRHALQNQSKLTVKAPPMVGPTWTRVRLTLGLDCLPVLPQGTALLLSHISWTAYCLHVCDSMIWVIQGCISMLHLSMSP